MSFGGDPGAKEDSSVQVYDLKSKNLTVWAQGTHSDPQYWNSSGKIVSVLDLPAAQMIIKVGHAGVSADQRDKRVEPDLTTIVLQVAERRDWWLRKDKLKLFKSETGSPFYVYTFPKTFDALLQEAEAK